MGGVGSVGGWRFLRGQSPLRATGPSVNPLGRNPTKAPVDLPLLDASGVVPFHLVAELVPLFYIVSVGMEQIEVVIGILAGDHEFCPQFVSAAL